VLGRNIRSDDANIRAHCDPLNRKYSWNVTL
jgi:hypothetical protein